MEVLSSMVGVLRHVTLSIPEQSKRSSGVHGFWTLLNACPEYQVLIDIRRWAQEGESCRLLIERSTPIGIDLQTM